MDRVDLGLVVFALACALGTALYLFVWGPPI